MRILIYNHGHFFHGLMTLGGRIRKNKKKFQEGTCYNYNVGPHALVYLARQ
jgi:hypothetical protein